MYLSYEKVCRVTINNFILFVTTTHSFSLSHNQHNSASLLFNETLIFLFPALFSIDYLHFVIALKSEEYPERYCYMKKRKYFKLLCCIKC